MARTKRNTYAPNRHWLDRVDIDPMTLKPYPERENLVRGWDRYRRGQDGTGESLTCQDATTDREGNFRISRWIKSGDNKFNRRHVNRIARQAHKRQVKIALYEWDNEHHFDEVEDWMFKVDNREWYDDEPMEYNDDIYFYDSYEDYDPYETCNARSYGDYDWREPFYLRDRNRITHEDVGKTLDELLAEKRAAHGFPMY